MERSDKLKQQIRGITLHRRWCEQTKEHIESFGEIFILPEARRAAKLAIIAMDAEMEAAAAIVKQKAAELAAIMPHEEATPYIAEIIEREAEHVG